MTYALWKYTLLLASMFLLLGVRLGFGHSKLGHLTTDLCVVVVVITAVAAACTRPRSRLMAFILCLPILSVTGWSVLQSPSPSHMTLVLQRVFMTVFLLFTIVTILLDLIDQRQITRDTLVGTFCGYVLLGVTWTELYCWIELVAPNSFNVASVTGMDASVEVRWNHLQYFSFVTLSTLGYGDVLPTTPLTRIMACLEAMCGQFYLAVLVAGLVSVRVSQLGSTGPSQGP